MERIIIVVILMISFSTSYSQYLEEGETLYQAKKFSEAYKILQKVPNSSDKKGKKAYKKAQKLMSEISSIQHENFVKENAAKTKELQDLSKEKNNIISRILVLSDDIHNCISYSYKKEKWLTTPKIPFLKPRFKNCDDDIYFFIQFSMESSQPDIISDITIKLQNEIILNPKITNTDMLHSEKSMSIANWRNVAECEFSKDDYNNLVENEIALIRISTKKGYRDFKSTSNETALIKYKYDTDRLKSILPIIMNMILQDNPNAKISQ